MIDLELGPDLHQGLKEAFGRRTDWPRGVPEAETLLAAIGHHLGREQIVYFLRCADMAQASCERSTSPGRNYADFLGAARAVFPSLNASDEVDLFWSTLAGIRGVVGAEHWARFLEAAQAGLEEEPAFVGAPVG